jgi:Xaa-Pro dipeptidase
MDTLQPTLKRGRDVWDPIRMPESEFRRRVEKLTREMRKRHIDLLLLYGNGQDDYAHPCYISSYLAKTPQGVIAPVSVHGDVALICQGFARDAALIQTTTWIKEIRSGEDLVQKCVEYLKEMRLLSSTIGFVGIRQFMPHREFEVLVEATRQCRTVDATHLVNRLRAVKSERECDQIRRSASIVSQAFGVVSQTPLPALTERALEAAVGRLAFLEGAEEVRVLIGRPGEANWSLRPPEEIPFSEGDPLILYLAVEFERYWAEGIRTFVVRGAFLAEAAPSESRALYQKIAGSLAAGKRVNEFYKEAMAKIKRSKVSSIDDYGLGQGIGLSLNESPFITEDETTPLKAGMCFALRLTLRNPELGAVMIGDTVHLSSGGLEVFTKA